MSKFHFSPRLERIAPCSGNCQFKNTPHFESTEEGEQWLAQEAKEKHGEIPDPKRKGRGRKEPKIEVKVIPPHPTREQLDEIVSDNTTGVTVGKEGEISEGEDGGYTTIEQYRSYQAAADQLVEIFREDDKYVLPDKKFDRYAIEKLSGHPDFEYLGTGCDKTAFLHKETGLVYKVVFARAGNDEYQKPYLKRYVEKEQELIAQVDDKDLANYNVRYAKNYFFESNEIPIIAQEYLPAEKYEEFPLDWSNPELAEYLEEKGFSDMHQENVRRNKETGEIVLFDCLQLGGHVIGEVTGKKM